MQAMIILLVIHIQRQTDQKLAALVDSAPATLNTLNELALALGNDTNFSTTVTTAIGTKQPTLTVTNSAASPLTLTNNILTVDLTAYAAKTNPTFSGTIYGKSMVFAGGTVSGSSFASLLAPYQKIFTASSPLSLNTTTNILSIDLTAYSTTTASDLRYQKLLTASAPLS